MKDGKTSSGANMTHRTNQMNPRHPLGQKAIDHRANQLNPNNSAYWQSRSILTPVNKK